MRSRLAVLQSAIEALRDGKITDELKNKAAQEAHKLAGSLGTFGLQSASDAANEIERLLSDESQLGKTHFRNVSTHFVRLKREIDSK